MAAVAERLPTGAPSSLAEQWSQTDWKAVNKQVYRLQVRIAKAVREKRYGKVRALQGILTRSHAGRLWAVRRVMTNRGRNTPGVDGVVWKTPEDAAEGVRSLEHRGYRPQPLRRVYIPKSRGRWRPLGIPTVVS